MNDEIDTQNLMILQENSRTSNAEIARQVGMAPSAVFERIRKLEAQGGIRGYEARLQPQALGLGLLAFVFVRTDDRGSMETGKKLALIPGVQEVHDIAGEVMSAEQFQVFGRRLSESESLARLVALANGRKAAAQEIESESQEPLTATEETG